MNLKRAVVLILFAVTITVSVAWAMEYWPGAYQRLSHKVTPMGQNQQRVTTNGNNNAKANAQPSPSEKVPAKNTALPGPFYEALDKALAARGWKLKDVCSLDDPVSRRVMEDYGAMFLTIKTAQPPPVCVFQDEAQVSKFQNDAQFLSVAVGGATIELQPEAMKALLAARADARKEHLDITPRGGAEAARRSFKDTLRLWNSRFLPALVHWTQRGRLSQKEAARLRALPVTDQVREVLVLEKRGIFFSQDFSKSILYSIAAPGTSQHTAMLALDVAQFGDARVRRILAAHGWFQTVKSDLPHFTFLGAQEKDLPGLGLTSTRVQSQIFWIPNIVNEPETPGIPQ